MKMTLVAIEVYREKGLLYWYFITFYQRQMITNTAQKKEQNQRSWISDSNGISCKNECTHTMFSISQLVYARQMNEESGKSALQTISFCQKIKYIL